MTGTVPALSTVTLVTSGCSDGTDPSPAPLLTNQRRHRDGFHGLPSQQISPPRSGAFVLSSDRDGQGQQAFARVGGISFIVTPTVAGTAKLSAWFWRGDCPRFC